MSDLRDRTADLDRLADAVIGHMEDGGESFFGLSGKRPFGSSDVSSYILDFIRFDPEGCDGYPECYSESQHDYAMDLWDDVLGHIKDRWRAIRRAEP